ncbi:hypothetical protein D3C72_1610170 [compost metagenome]
MALQQADHRQRQKNDQRQVARLDEAGADGREDRHRAEAGGERRDDGRDDHDQHRIEAQDEPRNDHGHADQRPQGDFRCHGWSFVAMQNTGARAPVRSIDANLMPMNEQFISYESLISNKLLNNFM